MDNPNPNPNRDRRRSRWIFAYEDEEPTFEQRKTEAARLSVELGTQLEAPQIPTPEDLELRASRIQIPDDIAEFTRTDNYDRAMHTYSSYSLNREAAIRGEYPEPVDAVAHPRTLRGQKVNHLIVCLNNEVGRVPFEVEEGLVFFSVPAVANFVQVRVL